jgi:hypothetical protein
MGGMSDRFVPGFVATIEESAVWSFPMTPQLMVQPSSFIRSGVQMSQLGEVHIFKFTDELQARFEELLSKNKQDALTPDERAELDGISELSRIFTLINAQLAAQAKWCPRQLENLSDNEPNSSASTVTPPNT